MKFIMIAATIFVATPFAAMAERIDDVRVGEVVCIDRFGPFNLVGQITQIDRSGNKVQVRDSDGDTDWYAGKKLRNVTACRVTSAGARWLIDQGIDAATSE